MSFKHGINTAQIKFGFGHSHVYRDEFEFSGFIIKLRFLDQLLNFDKIFFSLSEIIKGFGRLLFGVIKTCDIIDEVKLEKYVLFTGEGR